MQQLRFINRASFLQIPYLHFYIGLKCSGIKLNAFSQRESGYPDGVAEAYKPENSLKHLYCLYLGYTVYMLNTFQTF